MPQAPEGAERDALELTLATLQGMSAFHSLGVGAEAMTAFERAYALLAGAPEHPMRGRLLHGFGYVSSLRGDYVEALVVAKRAEALAAVSDDPELMLVACFLHGEAHHLQGRTQAARSWMERGLAIAETLDLAANDVFAADPQVTLLGMLAIDLVRCGLVQQGRALVQRAHARAAELRQPMTRLVAAWQEATARGAPGQRRSCRCPGRRDAGPGRRVLARARPHRLPSGSAAGPRRATAGRRRAID